MIVLSLRTKPSDSFNKCPLGNLHLLHKTSWRTSFLSLGTAYLKLNYENQTFFNVFQWDLIEKHHYVWQVLKKNLIYVFAFWFSSLSIVSSVAVFNIATLRCDYSSPFRAKQLSRCDVHSVLHFCKHMHVGPISVKLFVFFQVDLLNLYTVWPCFFFLIVTLPGPLCLTNSKWRQLNCVYTWDLSCLH